MLTAVHFARLGQQISDFNLADFRDRSLIPPSDLFDCTGQVGLRRGGVHGGGGEVFVPHEHRHPI